MIALLTATALLSFRFEYGGDQFSRPLPLMVTLLCAAGVVYFIAAVACRSTPNAKPLLGWIIVVGISARAIFLFSTPICETDFYRYLWDGGVTASGHNPFGYVPADVIGGDAPLSLVALGQDAGQVLGRVNHPHLATVYPPTCQAAFVVAHWLKPWNLTAWRIVLLVFDATALLLLFLLLKKLKLPLAALAIYWWNPLVIKEVVNSGHMDIIILPFLLGALLLALNRRYKSCAAVLALAVGAKLWPIILLPLLLRPLLKKPRRLIPAVLVFAGVLAVLFVPLAAAVGVREESGFLAYAQQWTMNDALFMALSKLVAAIPGLFGIEMDIATATDYTYYLMILMVLFAIFVTNRIKDSRIGRAWMALREDEIACVAMGVDMARTKLSAYAFGAFWAGLVGVIFAARNTYINPNSFTFMESAIVLSIVVLGGMGSIVGVIIAALVLILMPEYLRAFAEYRMLIFGAVMVLMMIFRPQGLISNVRKSYGPRRPPTKENHD